MAVVKPAMALKPVNIVVSSRIKKHRQLYLKNSYIYKSIN